MKGGAMAAKKRASGPKVLEVLEARSKAAREGGWLDAKAAELELESARAREAEPERRRAREVAAANAFRSPFRQES